VCVCARRGPQSSSAHVVGQQTCSNYINNSCTNTNVTSLASVTAQLLHALFTELTTISRAQTLHVKTGRADYDCEKHRPPKCMFASSWKP
jgi:hypothetical protein